MKEKVECKNTHLSFYSESSMTEFSSPVGNYLKRFPFENFDFERITTRPEELSKLIEELNDYFTTFKLTFQFPTGVVSSPHIIWIDKTRTDQLKVGFLPVYLSFVSPNIPPSKGYFSWDD
ncbi:MAG: hypothetical protein ABSD71_05390 [Bacteroidales bacterium]|jgi:hypothetical protein